MADLSFEYNLREPNRDRTRVALDAVHGTSWTCDNKGALRSRQPDWEKLTGQSYDRYCGYGWLDTIHPDDRRDAIESWRRAVGERRLYAFANRIRRRDGAWRQCLIRAVPQFDTAGELWGWIGVHLDITDLIPAETPISAPQQEIGLNPPEYAAILNQLGEGVIVTDAKGRIIFVNDAAVRLHGVKQLEVEPDDYSETYHLFTPEGEPYPAHGLPLARAVLRGETVIDARWLIRRPDGTEVLAIGTATPLIDRSGNHQGGVLTIRDDTARHAAETKLAKLNETLESRIEETIAEREVAEAALRQAQKMEAVGQLTGGIAHDFNNLLTIILGSADLLHGQIGTTVDERAARNLANITAAADKAAALTQRLLAFARQQPLDPRPTDLARLIGDMEDLIKRTIGETIVFEAKVQHGLGRVLVDAHQLENVLLNLAVNARDAMPNGGELMFRAEPVEVGAGDFADLAPGGYAAISATDTGTGMSDEVVAHAYEPFFTTKESGKGTGLGLSMVYGFVKQSGGHIDIDSAPGQGTTIRLLLPIERPGGGPPA